MSNDILKLIRKSKTAKAGVLAIIAGILILVGITATPAPETIDQMEAEQQGTMSVVVGAGALLAGVMTLKGRNDVEKRIKKGQ